MEDRTSLWKIITCSGSITPNDRRNQRVAVVWLAAWMAVFLYASDAASAGQLAGMRGWVVVSIPVLVGLIAMMVYRNFLRQADELLRHIHYEGLAVGFAVGLVGAFTVSLLAELTTWAVGAADTAALMALSYALTVVVRTRQFSA